MHGWLVRLKKPTTEYSKTTGGPSERMSGKWCDVTAKNAILIVELRADEQKRAFLAKARK
jgi:hypothetical protein